MSSSIPKPPQRIRVEMPAEVAPHPVPETAFETGKDAGAPAATTEKQTSNKVHVIHPRQAAPAKTIAPDVDTQATEGTVNIPADEELYKRQYYTIGEVADMFGANQSQIRFWENEFDILQPRKNKKGDRHFRPEDIKNLVLIYHLLRERRFTIEGAKEFLKRKQKRVTDTHQAIQQLEKIKSFLLEMKVKLAEGEKV